MTAVCKAAIVVQLNILYLNAMESPHNREIEPGVQGDRLSGVPPPE